MDQGENRRQPEPLIPRHGGYRNLKSFQVAQLVYDVTAAFCEAHIERRSRTHDQMVQAARSGVQNIAEGSQASATSRKTEMKLTNVARASLEELRLDYEDYLRQRGLEQWPPDHPALMRFKARRCVTLGEVLAWRDAELELQGNNEDRHGQENKHGQQDTDSHGQETTDNQRQTRTGRNAPSSQPSVPVSAGPCKSVLPAQLMANAALSLLNVACYLLSRQLAAQATAFEREGGFTERLYSHRRTHKEP
ncbi:MAG: four helix bundle protein [Dehalococcoidia bacterium]|nr:four helix bundle protein [Dehalococcoidia bacterium]